MPSHVNCRCSNIESFGGKIYITFGDQVICIGSAMATQITFGSQLSPRLGDGYLERVFSHPVCEITLIAYDAEICDLSVLPKTQNVQDMSIKELFETIQKKLNKRKQGE